LHTKGSTLRPPRSLPRQGGLFFVLTCRPASASAVLYRKRYLKQAEPVVRDVRTLEAIFSCKPPRINDSKKSRGSPKGGADALVPGIASSVEL